MLSTLVTLLLYRLKTAVLTLPTVTDWLWTIALLLIYGLIYLPIGFRSGFLKVDIQSSGWLILGITLRAFFTPGLGEEVLFRVLPLPHPSEAVPQLIAWLWIIGSWIVFLLYHPFNIDAPPFFGSPIFLLGAGLLGIICTIAYLHSGSIWTAVFLHWFIVAVWLLFLGGLAKFQTQ